LLLLHLALFFNFAADTIFMALVICMVEPIDVILLRISFKFAILYYLNDETPAFARISTLCLIFT